MELFHFITLFFVLFFRLEDLPGTFRLQIHTYRIGPSLEQIFGSLTRLPTSKRFYRVRIDACLFFMRERPWWGGRRGYRGWQIEAGPLCLLDVAGLR